MSVHFAIPATTFVLRAILQKRLEAAYGTFAPPPVSIEPPPRPPSGNGTPAPETPGLILYLHHAGPNPARRNMDGSHIDSSGAQLSRPPLVLDLHYMLAAQGLGLEREVVLGIGMSAFNRNGIIPRKIIKALMGTIVVPPVPTNLMDTLTAEPLDKQTDSITISQQPVDIDLSTKLWSALQSPLRPTAFYLVTTVFLANEDPVVEGEPVTNVRLFERAVVDAEVDLAGDADAEITKPLP